MRVEDLANEKANVVVLTGLSDDNEIANTINTAFDRVI